MSTAATPPRPGSDAGPGGAGAGAGAAKRLSRRTLCILLLLVAAVIAADMWVEFTHDTFDWHDPGTVPNMDFAQYYAGGHNWMLGLDPYVNHPGAPGAIAHPRMNQPEITGYIYPPTLLPLFGALSKLTYETARTVWLAIDVAAFALLIAVAALLNKGRRLETVTAAVLLTVVSFPFYWHVTYGQIDMVVAALTICAFLLYPRWRGWPSALLFAVAIATKVTPVVILAAAVAYYRDWRLLLRALVCGAAVFAVSLLAVDWSLFAEYATKILPAISTPDPSPYNQTPLRFWWRYPGVVKAVSVLGYAALVWIAWVAGRTSRRLDASQRRVDPRTEKYALLLFSVLMMLFFSPLAWQQAYVWPIVPLALVFVSPPPREKPWALFVLGVAAFFISAQVVQLRGLDMPNIAGAGLALVTLLLAWLPLDQRAGGDVPARGGAPGG